MKRLTGAWNPRFIRRNTMIQIVIVSLALVMLLRVWPLQCVKNHTYSKQQTGMNGKELQGEKFADTDKKLQTVIFSNSHLYQITMYLSCSVWQEEDRVLFRLYNGEFSCIYEEEYACSKIAEDGYLRVTPDMEVEQGKDYYYEVIVPEESGIILNVPVADNNRLLQEENAILYIDGIINTDISLIADFHYVADLPFITVIFYDILIVAATMLCYIALIFLLDRMEDSLPAVLRYAKWGMTVLTAIAGVTAFMIAVVCNVFGGGMADRVVYALGIAGGICCIMCAVWLPGAERKPSKLAADRQISLLWRNYIQTVCFGFLFYALCQYVNADREYYHDTNTRWMLIFFGIAILMIRSEQELLKFPCYVWLGISIVSSVIYCNGFQEEQDLYLARLTAAVVMIWGLVLIHAMMQYKKICLSRICKPFFAVWLIFAALMYLFRYQKTWPFTATLPFFVIVFYNLSESGKSRLLKNFTNGILLSFALVLLFSFHHRPYHFWIRYRYNMIFHTVASTGMYLSTVFAAAIGKLYSKCGEKGLILEKVWKELLTVGAVICFVLFTMSRTAILTVAVCLCLVLALSGYLYRKNIRTVAAEAAGLALAVIISFPLMYSAIRIIPAVINNPIRYDIEPQDESYMIYEGDPVDSDKYMTIERYFRLLFYRFDVQQTAKIRTQEQEQEDTLIAYIGEQRLPVAASMEEEQEYVLEDNSDVSNGRFGIYMDYLQNLNLTGHEQMQLEDKDYAHAHNSYIQVAYDFGIITGIVFLVICAYTLIKSVMYYIKFGKKYRIFMIPFALVVSFGLMSITEWAFHPCIPAGFGFIFVQMLFMQQPMDTGRIK